MSESRSISRRTALSGLSAAGLGMTLASTGSQTAAQVASPEPSAMSGIVGTWVIQFEDPAEAPVVAIFGADGNFVDAGMGHAGVWEAAGPSTFSHTWVHVFPANSNYVVVSGTIELDETGDSWTQAYSSMVVSADGAVINTGSGNVQARRLHVVPVDQMGTRLEVVPTWTPVMATPT